MAFIKERDIRDGAVTASKINLKDSAALPFGDGDDASWVWDGTRFNLLQATPNSELRWGVDGAGWDQIWYGDTPGAYLHLDQSADVLNCVGVFRLGVVSRSVGPSTAAAGSTTSDAGVLPAGTAGVYPTTAADDTKGVRVHASDKVTGRQIWIGNGVSNKILKVYAPAGGSINGAAGDAAFSSASGKGVVMICLDSAANTWLAF